MIDSKIKILFRFIISQALIAQNSIYLRIKFLMMEIELLAFGITKDIIGERKTKLSVKEETTVKELRVLLHAKYPELIKLRSLAIACNETYALDDEVLPSMCIVALIPPVSGG